MHRFNSADLYCNSQSSTKRAAQLVPLFFLPRLYTLHHTLYTLHLTPKNRSSGRFGVFGTVFATCVCEMIHWHHAYIKKALERGLTSHHHLVCAVGNNAMKHSYIVPPPPAASACCMVLPLDVSWSPSSYCFVQVCGR